MPKVRFLPSEQVVEVPLGTTILDAALEANIDLDHNCGGNCACSTCHVIVEAGMEKLTPLTDDEQDMLDEAIGLTPTSRLACQCQISGDVVARIPQSFAAMSDFDD